jgi:SHS2 domain-containing protein
MPKSDRFEPWLSELDHTGDVGFVIRAPALEALFERSAKAMFTVLVDADVETTDEKRIEIDAPDREALLVRWLSELNYLHQVDGWVFTEFQVRLIGDSSLVGTARGNRAGSTRVAVQTEIKAVTYHGLYIRSDGTDWEAQIIFDL